MLNGMLDRPKVIDLNAYFNQDLSMGTGVFPDETCVFAYNVEEFSDESLKRELEELHDATLAKLIPQDTVQADVAEGDLEYETASYRKRHEAEVMSNQQLFQTLDTEGSDEASHDISMIDVTDADSTFQPCSSSSNQTTEKEFTFVEVHWEAKIIKAAAKGHSKVPKSRDDTLFETEDLKVYTHQNCPTASDPNGVWLTTTSKPFHGHLHFGHQYMQKQRNSMSSPYAENIWKCFPTEQHMCPEKQTEAFKMLQFWEANTETSFVRYNTDERYNLTE